MSGRVRHMHFNFDEIKSTVISCITRTAFRSDGIIFGGAVRDFIISQSYAKKYQEYLREKDEKFKSKRFWDVKNHPESAARTLVPRDIDIYFEKRDKADIFIGELNESMTSRDIEVEVNNITTCPDDINRDYGRMLNVQTIRLVISFGKIPFIHMGYNITLDIDIVTPCYPVIMLPPFNNLDFLCNGFINTKHGIMYSTNTGTYIDKLSHVERAEEIAKIQKDMLSFKTTLCKYDKIRQHDVSTFGKNSNAWKRVKKLLSKTCFEWTIDNLPFKIAKAAESDCDTECCICIEKICANDTITYMLVDSADKTAKVKSSIMHKACMTEYFDKQCEEARHDHLVSHDEFTFICPMRYTIDFTKCEKA